MRLVGIEELVFHDLPRRYPLRWVEADHISDQFYYFNSLRFIWHSVFLSIVIRIDTIRKRYISY